ncbi:MAG: Synechococcus phage [Bacteroidota bacterium]|jgi:archaellum biogenesis ATPase FlaH
MVAVHLEKIFFHYLLSRKELISVVNNRFFETDDIKKIYDITKEFTEKYNSIPTKSQIVELTKVKGIDGDLVPSKIESLFDVNLKEYDDDWLQQTAESWIEYKNLDISVLDLITYLKTTKVSVDNVKDVVQNAKNIITERNNIQFGFDEGLDFFNPDSHIQPTSDTFSSGFSYIDLVLGGGFYSKALFCYIGEMKIGKSIWLANIAANCVRLGYNTAVLSLEMRDRKLVKRLGANLLNVNMKEYAKAAEDKVMMKKKLTQIGYDSLQVPGKLYVKEFPTSSAGVPDIEMYLQKMEETKGIKFKVIVLDYINILKNWRNPNSENMYMKIKQIAEDLRAMAMRNDWAIITATQINRSGFGSTDLNATNISESAALGHTVDAMFGIIQDEIMHANREYILKLIANRDDGYKNSRRKFLINYDYMRIVEDPDSTIITE